MLKALKPSEGPKGVRFGPAAIVEDLSERVPRYLNDVDQGKLIYSACRRALSDANGDVRSVWDDTRLEAMRYVMVVPGQEFDLLSGSARQIEMIDAYLFQRAHASTRSRGNRDRLYGYGVGRRCHSHPGRTQLADPLRSPG